MKNLLKRNEFPILIITILLVFVLSLMTPNFFTIRNFVDISKGNTIYGIMALGMLCVLITGGIDLSIPGNITLTSLVCGKLLVNTGMGIAPILIICIIVGGLVGLVNGLLVTKLKLPAMVITLGINSILMCSVLYYTDGNMITGLPKWFQDFGFTRLFQVGDFSIPIQVVFLIVAAIITSFILHYTVIGRGVYAVGGSELSALRVGYKVDKIKILVYVYMGMLVGLAGFINTSIVQGVNPNTYVGIDMTVISIAVIGGASTLGGVGSVFGTILGTILMAFINNGLIIARVPTYWQNIVMGIIILAAITIDVVKRNIEKGKLVKVDVEE